MLFLMEPNPPLTSRIFRSLFKRSRRTRPNTARSTLRMSNNRARLGPRSISRRRESVKWRTCEPSTSPKENDSSRWRPSTRSQATISSSTYSNIKTE